MKKEIEAILFSSPDPLDLVTIAKILKVDVEKVKDALDELIKEYESRDTAIEILRLGERVVMRVKPPYQHLVHSKERDLDRSTLRTLALIALNQPLELSKLAKIRGNRCYEHVKRLEELGLIKSEKKGRTKILTTTDSFIKYFGLDAGSIEEVKRVLKSILRG